MAADASQMMAITMLVRLLVTRTCACSGNMMAMKRSQEIADKVSTLHVRHVTAKKQQQRAIINVAKEHGPHIANKKRSVTKTVQST